MRHGGMVRGLAGMAVAVVLGAGCSSSDDEPAKQSPTPRGTGSAASTAADPCALLSAREREALAGRPVDTEQQVDVTTADYTCRWSSGANPTKSTLIQVSSTSASRWAEDLPTIIDNAKAAGKLPPGAGPKLEYAEKKIQAGTRLGDDEACALFSVIAEANGQPKGTTQGASFFDVAQGVRAVSAQICEDGEFTSVVYAAPDLPSTDAVSTASLAAAKRAHQAALDAASD